MTIFSESGRKLAASAAFWYDIYVNSWPDAGYSISVKYRASSIEYRESSMQCQICNKNDATIHLTEIAEGVRAEMHVCEHCAQEQGIAVKSQIPLNELLSSLLAVQPTDEELFGPSEKGAACPHCGFTLAQFRKEAVLGCPYDYEVFEKPLLNLIKKAHNGKTNHCGKVPSKTSTGTKEQIKLIALRQQLEAAVRSEDYERAAKLRDKINKCEN
ncbi:MAG TPA: UvrB/UvrC motif-containing protein [Sedimentisphaerales bacterium]|nr:UvrB/UvrC motif-containing protein [Sedimentisphaerales bacterium]